MPRVIAVELVGDPTSLLRAFAKSEQAGRQFGKTMDRASRQTDVAGAVFHNFGRAVAYASASFFGAAGFVGAVEAGFKELFATEKQAAQTAAVLKSTGGIAGVTAGHVSELADSLAKLTGYGTNAIHSAENLLLAFTNVRNVAGQNNDIFNQATEATLNLSRAFGRSLPSSAVLLGKALQDPIRGMTSLRRVGVSFSEAQQTLIKRLVRTGDVLDAQKIILREVTQRTGDAAEAYGKTLPGQLSILQGNLQTLAGELAKTLNPQVKLLTERFNKWLENPENKKKIIDDFTASVHALGMAFKFAADMIGAATSLWDKLGGFLQQAIKTSLLFGPALWKSIHPGGGGLSKKDRAAVLQAIASGRRIPVTATYPTGGGAGGGGGAKPPGTVPTPKPPRGVTVAQRNAWFDALISRQLGRVDDIRSLQGQNRRLGQIAQEIRNRIAVTKDITRRLKLEDEVLDILRQQRQNRDTIRQQAADAAKKAAEQAAKNVKAAADRIQKINQAAIAQAKAIETRAAAMRRAAQFRALGLTAAGKQRTTIKWLRRRAAQVAKKISGTSADTATNRARLARIHYVLTTWNELDPAVAEEIRHELDDIAGDVGGTTTMAASLFQHVPASRLARMLGVGGNRAARGILSQYGAGGSLPRGSLAFGGGSGVYIGAIHVHDARGLKNELQRLQRGQPSNRRGAR